MKDLANYYVGVQEAASRLRENHNKLIEQYDLILVQSYCTLFDMHAQSHNIIEDLERDGEGITVFIKTSNLSMNVDLVVIPNALNLMVKVGFMELFINEDEDLTLDQSSVEKISKFIENIINSMSWEI